MTHMQMGARSSTILMALLSLSGCHKSTAAPAAGPVSPEPVAEAEPPQGPACGQINCAVGEICCNASCSICTPPDGMCTQQICETDSPGPVPGSQGGASSAPGETPPASGAVNGSAPVDESKVSCANVRCAAGTHCEMVQVECVKAPCHPVPECRADVAPAAGAELTCGKSTCAPGQTCCNASCGICTDPGKGCIKMLCPDGQMPKR